MKRLYALHFSEEDKTYIGEYTGKRDLISGIERRRRIKLENAVIIFSGELFSDINLNNLGVVSTLDMSRTLKIYKSLIDRGFASEVSIQRPADWWNVDIYKIPEDVEKIHENRVDTRTVPLRVEVKKW